MITYKEHKDILEDINPFTEWKVIDRELKISQAKPLRKWNAPTIPFSKMKYGDSVFMEVPFSWYYYNYYLPVVRGKKELFKLKLLKTQGFFMKVEWMDIDPKYKRAGVRVWSFQYNHKIKSATRIKLILKKAA